VPPYVLSTAARILCAYFESAQVTIHLISSHSYLHSTLIVQYNWQHERNMSATSTVFKTSHFLVLWLVAILLTRYFTTFVVGFLLVVRTWISSECCHLLLLHCIMCLILKLLRVPHRNLHPLDMTTMPCAQMFLLPHRLSQITASVAAMETRLWLTHTKVVGENWLIDINITKHTWPLS
jgi:hypothetical protein